MSGYLPPHTKEGPASELFKTEYEVTSSKVDDSSPPASYDIYLPADAKPELNTIIKLGPEKDPIQLPPLGFGLWGWGDVLTYGWGPSGGYDQKVK
jgi:hypothetical protein